MFQKNLAHRIHDLKSLLEVCKSKGNDPSGLYWFSHNNSPKPCHCCGKLSDFFIHFSLNGVEENAALCEEHNYIRKTNIPRDIAKAIHWRHIRNNKKKIWLYLQLVQKIKNNSIKTIEKNKENNETSLETSS